MHSSRSRQDRLIPTRSLEEVGEVALAVLLPAGLASFGLTPPGFLLPEGDVGAGRQPVLLARACLDDDGRAAEQPLGGDVDPVAAGLAQAAADALLGLDHRRQVAAALHRVAVLVAPGAHPQELDRVVPGRVALVDAELARLAARVGQAGPLVDHGQSDAGDPLLLQRQGADGAGGADLPAGVAARVATGPVGGHARRPQPLQPLLEPERLEHVVGARLEALAAADAHLKELRLGNAPRRAHWPEGARVVEAGAEGPRAEAGADPPGGRRRDADGGREEAPAADRRLARGRIIRRLQLDELPAVDELDGVRRADAAAGLAERAVGGAGREVGLDGVERADLHAPVAVDAARLHLPLARAEQVRQREDRPARADVLAPEAGAEQAQGEHAQEQRDR